MLATTIKQMDKQMYRVDGKWCVTFGPTRFKDYTLTPVNGGEVNGNVFICGSCKASYPATQVPKYCTNALCDTRLWNADRIEKNQAARPAQAPSAAKIDPPVESPIKVEADAEIQAMLKDWQPAEAPAGISAEGGEVQSA